MLITKTSMLTGKDHTMELDVTLDQIAKWQAGLVAQLAFPNLTAAQREFLISGSTEDEWNQYMKDDEEEER